ncbi:SRPBCC domain-containing protein [Nocardia sp. NPDC051570]|uniref:SRPBCC domain-containing protein n=1 Tax=Nocardia sp. NPDC051570 TaxID=3364324 RepID=UPI0037B8D1C2
MISDAGLDPAAVEVGAFLSRPTAAVWHALTDPDLLARWLMRPTGFTTSVGTHFIFSAPAQSPCAIVCEILAARPDEQLTYSWTYPGADPPIRWIVDWTMQPQGRGTRLLLTQTGFDIEDRRQKMMRNAMERGWRNVLPRLRDVLGH